MAEIILREGREKSVIQRHPWIFSGAVAKINGSPRIGETADIISTRGEFLARAAINTNSKIIGRIWTWEQNENIDSKFFSKCIEKSFNARSNLNTLIQSDACRLVYAESDNLPGLIIDRYGDTYVVQFLTAGIEFWKDEIISVIRDLTHAKIIYERSDVDVRQLEGLESRKGLLFGNLHNEQLVIIENGITYHVDISNGHKTGFYLDQRDNRLLVRLLSSGCKVLDCFSYTGGFGINALVGGAKSVTFVDSSALALDCVRDNLRLNQLNLDIIKLIDQDVFKYMRTLRDIGETFDLIILDPPKFAPTSVQAEKAARGYKDINLLALKLLKPGGYLFTFSCSGGVSEELFQKIVTGAALDAGVEAVILKHMYQAADHPVALNFPEGAYLKGFILQKRK